MRHSQLERSVFASSPYRAARRQINDAVVSPGTGARRNTRGLIAAAFGPAVKAESDRARELTCHLTPDMLLLADRAFDGNELLTAITRQGTQFLVRCTSTRRPPVLALLPDGSYLTRIGSLSLRVIEAEVQARTVDQHIRRRLPPPDPVRRLCGVTSRR
ncbi:hypothetical protein [Streptomyces bobili]|uniref:hypothetical protein n=1 Tax=Streptomyces bobili TaxID=67280 RepID=UPI003789A0E3